ncbi:MAG: radical SAM protein [Smithellaceae bacterium]|nr:radical SAM protein [Smithellaceae bacterium]
MKTEQNLPNTQINGESPEFVQTSLAGAMAMGLMPGKFERNAQCVCLNLLETYADGCNASCSYCGLARNRNREAQATFIRVKWPAYPLSEIISRVQTRPHPFRRVCVSMVTHRRALDDACAIISGVREKTGLPVSGLLSPTVMDGKSDLEKIHRAGADRIGIAIDAVTPELFEKHRGIGVGGPHKLEVYMQSLEDAVSVFGAYMVGVHLIVGLGETQRQMIDFIDRANKMKVATHLFSFFPESGSLLEAHPQPALRQYRHIQLARYLINEKIVSADSMRFSSLGEVTDFGVDIEPYLAMGTPFMTSGCPGNDGLLACNRPFGNERASEPMRNYPFVPVEEDIVVIRSQMMR